MADNVGSQPTGKSGQLGGAMRLRIDDVALVQEAASWERERFRMRLPDEWIKEQRGR